MRTDKMNSRYWMVLIAMCGLSTGAAGILINAAGVFYTPIAEELGVGRGDVSMMMTILSLVSAVCGMLVPKILKKMKLRILALVGTVLMVGGTLLMAASSYLWQLYLLCAIRGIAGGIIGFVLISIILNNWFIERLGLMTSIALGFSGVAGALLSPITSSVIERYSWRTGFVFLAVLMALTSLPAILMPITTNPEDLGMKQYGWKPLPEVKEEKTETDIEEQKPADEKKIFIICLLFSLLGSTTCSFVPHLPSYAVSIGFDASVGALMLSAGMIANIVGKLFIGSFSDRIGSGKTLLVTIAVSAVSFFLLTGGFGKTVMLVGAFLCGLTYAISAVGRVIVTKDMYGRERYGKVYPTFNFFASSLFALFGSVYGYVSDITGSYLPCLMIQLIGTVLLAVIVFIGYFTGKKKA